MSNEMSNVQWQNVGAVVLAAGRGARLNSAELPKVMLPIGGRPMVSYGIETLERAGFVPEQICLVVGFQQQKVRDYFGARVTYAAQDEQKGTAHAAYTGMRVLPKEIQHVLVMGGDDSAFYTPETLRSLIDQHVLAQAVLTLLSAEIERPEQLGRIVRHGDGKVEIIEKEYLTEEQKKIEEISAGTFVLNRAWFENIFPNMPPLRKLGEYGLPTALAMAREAGLPYQVIKLTDSREWFGVNTPEELAEADRRKTEKISV